MVRRNVDGFLGYLLVGLGSYRLTEKGVDKLNKEKLFDDLKEILTFKPDGTRYGIPFYHISVNEIKQIIEVLEESN